MVATKGGTNELHGSLIYFNRNRATAANNFFSNRAGLAIPKYNRNEYGGSAGGPIKKNKLFYFGNFEGYRLASAATNTLAMPTTAMRTGDFSALAGAIVDPFSNNTPFPGNKIPTSRISPVAQGLDGYFSAPNLPGVGGLGANYTVNVNQVEPTDRYSGRIDYNMTDRDRISGRYFRSADGPYNATGAGSEKFLNWGGFGNDTNNTMASYTRILTPNMVSVRPLRVAGTTIISGRRRTAPSGSIQADSGSGSRPFQVSADFRPLLFSASRASAISLVPATARRTTNSRRLLTWTRGKHALKGGFEFQRISSLQSPEHAALPRQFQFRRPVFPATRSPIICWARCTPLPATSRNALNEPVDNRYFAYLQDDWKVSNTLTVNAGVRYEFQGLFHNSQNDLWRTLFPR